VAIEPYHYCRLAGDEKVIAVGMNDSVASCGDSALASGDVTMDSIKEHKYEFDSVLQQQYTDALFYLALCLSCLCAQVRYTFLLVFLCFHLFFIVQP